MSDDLLHVEVVSADRVVWSGEATRVIARTTEGDVGILPNHAPLLSLMVHGVVDVLNAHDVILRIRSDGGAHPATGGGERHLDLGAIATFLGRHDAAIVNESEVDDVHGDLWVINFAQGVPDFVLEIGGLVRDVGGGTCLFFFPRIRIDAERVGILGRNAGQPHIGGDGVGAAERLGDDDLQADGELDRVAAGDLDGVDFAFEFDGGMHGGCACVKEGGSKRRWGFVKGSPSLGLGAA